MKLAQLTRSFGFRSWCRSVLRRKLTVMCREGPKEVLLCFFF